MKTTTKILISTTTLLWCISIVIFGINHKEEHYTGNYNTGDTIVLDNTFNPIPPTTTHIVISDSSDSYYRPKIVLAPTYNKNTPGIHIAKKIKKYVSFKTIGDSLKIKISIPYDSDFNYSDIARTCIHISADSVKHIHDYSNNCVTISEMTLDSLSIIEGDFELNNCNINKLIIGKMARISFINSNILEYSFIGDANNWRMVNYHIVEEKSY